MSEPSPSLGIYDTFGDVEHWTAEQGRTWVYSLNRRAAAPDQVSMRSRIIQQLTPASGKTILELGCGTGRLLYDLSCAIGSTGAAIGLEPQRWLAEEATQFLLDIKRLRNLSILPGRAESIPLIQESVDACVAQTTLIHIPPSKLLAVCAEVKRILKPGGKFISVDQDGDTWVIDHPQREVTRKIVRFNSDYRYADGWTGRHLRRLFMQTGFTDVKIECIPYSVTEHDDYLYLMAERIAKSAAERGAISENECRDWLSELKKRATDGNFFSSISFFCCQGRKPS